MMIRMRQEFSQNVLAVYSLRREWEETYKRRFAGEIKKKQKI